MENLIQDFRAKVKEITLYFRYLELFDDDQGGVTVVPNSGEPLELDREFIIIMRANAFLLLYNMVEATIYDLIEEVCSVVNSSSMTYEELPERLRATWLKISTRNLRNVSTDRWYSILSELVNELVNKEKIELDYKKVMHSAAGSLDAKKVRSIASEIGFSSDVGRVLRGGEKLLIVKTKRNALAHGDVSFLECGRDYRIDDILVIKRQVVGYLWATIKNVKRYVESEQFDASQAS